VRDGSPQRHPIRRPAITFRVEERGDQIAIMLSA